MRLSDVKIKRMINEGIQSIERNVVDLVNRAKGAGFNNYISDHTDRGAELLNDLTQKYIKNKIIKDSRYKVQSIWCSDGSFSREEGVITVTIYDKTYRDNNDYEYSNVKYGSSKIMSDLMFQLTVDTMNAHIQLSDDKMKYHNDDPEPDELMPHILEIVRKNLPHKFTADIETGKFNYQKSTEPSSSYIIIRYKSDNSYCGYISFENGRINYNICYGAPGSGSTCFEVKLENIDDAIYDAVRFLCN